MNESMFFWFRFEAGVAVRVRLFVDGRLIREGRVRKFNKLSGGSAEFGERDGPRVPMGNGNEGVEVRNGVVMEPLAEGE